MEAIQWPNYNGAQFQLFCNALLSFELGRGFQPFSSPGKDGGIDGLYHGAYGSHSGHWRFQYKFSKQARADAAAMIRSGLPAEIDKLQDDDVFVLLTNVELSPQEQAAMQQTFREKTAARRPVAFEIWDGAVLFNLYLKYPILELWLDEGFQTAQLQDYRQFFRDRLEQEGFHPGAYNNQFIARETDIAGLTAFLDGPLPMAVISGEAGIGKTRLVIEFFQQVVAQRADWAALVLVNYQAAFDRLRKALLSKEKFIILVDDAHQYTPSAIADLRALCRVDGQVKLVLTTRNLQASGPLTFLSSYDRENVYTVSLGTLSRADTRTFFEEQLQDNSHYRNFIGQLIDISGCKPVVIIALLAAIAENMPISKIKEQGFLKRYLADYFESYYKEVQRQTNIPLAGARRLLQCIVLVEPVDLASATLIDRLAELLELPAAGIGEALRLLKKNGLMSGRFTQSMKPDIYSDILLSDIDRADAEHFIGGLTELLHHVVVNLSSVDEIVKREKSLLDELLDAYVRLITLTEDVKVAGRILETMVSICLVHPAVAGRAVDHYLDQLAVPGSVLAKDFLDQRKYDHMIGNTPFQRVQQVLFNSLYLPAQYEPVYRRYFRLYSLTAEMKLAEKVYHFARRDVTDYFVLSRQQFFLDRTEKTWGRMKTDEQLFALHTLKQFLALDFHGSEPDSVNADQIVISTYMVPAIPAVIKLRSQLIAFLSGVYTQAPAAARQQALEMLIDIPRAIFATERNSRPYDGDAEKQQVLDFIEAQAHTLSLKQQKDVLDKLYWYRRWGICEAFLAQLDRIQDALKPKNLAATLMLLFSKTETSILDFKNVEQHIAERSREIISANGPEPLSRAVTEMLAQEKQPPHFYYSFQRVIEHEFPEHARILYETLRRSGLETYYYLGPSLLYGLYYELGETDYYWAQVALLEQDNDPKSDSALLRIYSRIIQGSRTFSDRDKAVIYRVNAKRQPENHHDLAGALQCLIAAGDAGIAEVCKDFLGRCHQREAEMFFIWLSDNKLAPADFINDVVIQATVRFQLTYEIERCLNKVLLSAGSDVVFGYFMARYQLKIGPHEEQEHFFAYDFMPDGEHSHLFDDCPPEIRTALFGRALDWFLTMNEELLEVFFAKELLTYLQPGVLITPALYDLFKAQLLPNITSGRLSLLLDAISIFHHKDELLLDLVIACYVLAREKFGDDAAALQLAVRGCYQALTTVGVRVGRAGEPFAQDLALESLLRGRLASLQPYEPEHELLANTLDYLQKMSRRFDDGDES
ncbi:ATP-binding protein [Mucilaginibacter sp. BJC16-A38]|uniref:ATP-binding protein n=1 Tax=Mucilaginibacter phenanthrenivorans TaxID=1234842 RepID=UPI0021574745|nr:ATP-binding protein [Mucilaginibacter phenanthrenivorans]MCR8556974.1 ATP-binding protein [Mucilaginibacter phenanthrenivorans]